MTLRTVSRALGLAALLPTSAAFADDVVLAPMIGSRGVSETTIDDIFQLMSSELEFMAGVDLVLELRPRPTALNPACLDSPRCLKVVTSEAKGNKLLAGTVEKAGTDVLIDLIWYDLTGNTVVRRKEFTLPADKVEMVDKITPVLVEMTTGEAPKEVQQDEMAALSFDPEPAADEEESFFAPDPEPAPEPEPTPVRRRDEPITPPPAPEPEEDFDPGEFDFGSSADDISFGSPEEITFGDPTEAEPEPEPAPTVRRRDQDIFLDPDLVEPARIDFEEEEEPIRRSSSSSKKKKEGKDVDDYRRVHIAARAGYTNYGIFNFATAGGEIQVRTVGGLFIVAGLEAHIARQCVQITDAQTQPQDPACGAAGFTTVTQAIYPANLGFVYRWKLNRFQPYVGLDGMFSQLLGAVLYPVAPGTSPGELYVALLEGRGDDVLVNPNREEFEAVQLGPFFQGGARLRAGVDVWIVRNFGLTLDVGLGFSASAAWPLVDQRTPEFGFWPHVGGGLVVGF